MTTGILKAKGRQTAVEGPSTTVGGVAASDIALGSVASDEDGFTGSARTKGVGSAESGKRSKSKPLGQSIPSATLPEMIIIHVCDENRKINRDFTCSKSLLLSEMRYFKTYLTYVFCMH